MSAAIWFWFSCCWWRQAGEVGGARVAGRGQRCAGRAGVGEQILQLGLAVCEARGGRSERDLGVRELGDDLLVLRGQAVEPVQGRDDLVQGFGAEKHGERVDVSLDVELAEPGGELRLRRLKARARDVERLLRRSRCASTSALRASRAAILRSAWARRVCSE